MNEEDNKLFLNTITTLIITQQKHFTKMFVILIGVLIIISIFLIGNTISQFESSRSLIKLEAEQERLLTDMYMFQFNRSVEQKAIQKMINDTRETILRLHQ